MIIGPTFSSQAEVVADVASYYNLVQVTRAIGKSKKIFKFKCNSEMKSCRFLRTVISQLEALHGLVCVAEHAVVVVSFSIYMRHIHGEQ